MDNGSSKKQRPFIIRFFIRLFQIILFIPLQIFFIPLAFIGLTIGIFREFGLSKKLGVSYSAGQTLQYRWFMHYFQTREDPYTVAFTKKFPCESHFGLWTTMGAFIVSQRLFGFKTKFGRIPAYGEETLETTAAARVLAFDAIMQKHLEHVDQIVLPGIGFDLIALHFTEGKDVKVFEMDQLNTLKIKTDTLDKAGIRHDWITYIPVDYEKESWREKLLQAGFDKTKKTLFLWQSVSHFLDAEIVKETQRTMAELCAEGSVIAQDFYSRSFIFENNSTAVKSQKKMMAKMGEPWKFGLDMSSQPRASVESFLAECGIKMTEYRQFGEKLETEPFYCIVEGVPE